MKLEELGLGKPKIFEDGVIEFRIQHWIKLDGEKIENLQAYCKSVNSEFEIRATFSETAQGYYSKQYPQYKTTLTPTISITIKEKK